MESEGTAPPAQGEPIRLAEPSSGFAAFAPPDFKLVHDPKRGVYELRSDDRGAVVEYMRVTSSAAPVETARAVVEQRGLEAVSERAEDERAVIVAKRPDGRRWTVDVRRDSPETVAVTGFGLTPGGGPKPGHDDERVLEWVAASASGGAPAAISETKVEQKPKPIELKDFTTPDGQAKGKVPAEPGWAAGGMNGALEASHPQRGELNLGLHLFICLPGGATAAMAQFYQPPWPIAPYMTADGAVVNVWPQVCNLVNPANGVGGVQIDSGQPLDWGQPFSAGVFGIRFQKASGPWRGAILAATAPLPADDKWLLYYSELAVPDSDDSSVGEALKEAWAAYDPSGSRDPRIAATRQALAAVTKTIQEVTTLRQQTFETTAANWSEQFRN